MPNFLLKYVCYVGGKVPSNKVKFQPALPCPEGFAAILLFSLSTVFSEWQVVSTLQTPVRNVHTHTKMHHTLITNEKGSGTASLPTMKRLPHLHVFGNINAKSTQTDITNSASSQACNQSAKVKSLSLQMFTN